MCVMSERSSVDLPLKPPNGLELSGPANLLSTENRALAGGSSPEKVDSVSRHQSLILFRRVVVNAGV